MVTFIQKEDLSAIFSNDNTNAAGGVDVKDTGATQRGVVDLEDEQQLGDGNKVFGGNVKAENFLGTVDTTTSDTLDATEFEAFVRTVTAARTFAFTGEPTRVTSFVLELVNGGSATVTWPIGIKWAGGTAPALTAAGTDLLGFYNRGAGWHGIMLSKDTK